MSSLPATRSQPVPLLPLGLVAAAVVGLFAPTFLVLVRRWEADPNYSHGYLVIPISLTLAYFAAGKAGAPVKGELILGILYLLSGLTIHLASLLFSWPLVDFFALAAVLRGVAVAAGGSRWAGAFNFPILFLIFMFPWPTTWTAQLAQMLQEWVSVVSAALLDLFVVCYRQGTSLHLAGVKEPLVVAEECSGLRQMMAFLALAALLGKLGGRSVPFRLLLLVLAVPVAVLANVVRVVLMATGAIFYGVRWMDSWLHHAPATFSLPLGVVLFLALNWALEKIWPAPAPTFITTTTTTEQTPCPSPNA